MNTKGQKHIVPFFTQRSLDYIADGYPSREVADHWQERSCGIACARMVVGAFNNSAPPAPWPLIEKMIERGAYLPGKGWVHAGIASFLNEEYGFKCLRRRVETVTELTQILAQGGLIIASIAVGLEGNSKSGHLAVVHDYKNDSGRIFLTIHHPSSWASYEWISKTVSSEHFLNYFSGNIIDCRP